MVKKIRILHPEELPGDAEQISRVLRQGLTDLNKVFDKIDYFNNEWNEQYNKHFFGTEDPNKICYRPVRHIRSTLPNKQIHILLRDKF